MAFRRPRLRLQPNVVARPPPAKQEPESAAPAQAAPAQTAPAQTAPAQTAPAAATDAPAVEQSAKPRPQLPARFKRLAPRLDIRRSAAAAAAAESTRTDGSTDGSPDGATVAAPPASSPVSAPPAPPAVPAADAVVCPAPAKRPRLDSARLPEPEDPAREPEDPDDPLPEPLTDPLAEPVPSQPQLEMKKEQQPPRKEHRELEPEQEPEQEQETGQEPGSPPLSCRGEGEGDGEASPLLSETDLFLRKRFNTPRTKSNTRELLEQISERVSDNMPIRSKMRMQDLILWNPATEGMSNSKEKPPNRRRKRRDSSSSVMSSRTEAGEEAAADDPTAPTAPPAPPAPPAPLEIPELETKEEEEEEEPDAMPVPQLKVGPDGSIVIDEKSLVVQTTQQKQRDQEMSTELVNDMTGSRLSFNGYRQRRKIDEWSIKETARFYKALSTVGTDFSIMQQLFPQRTRVDLKKKFKKEERKNPHLVERAMTDNMQYDLTIFDGDVWEKTVEDCKTAAQMKKEEAREKRKQVRERDVQHLKTEKAARRSRTKVIKEEKKGAASDILDSMKAPLEKTVPRRRRPARGRENVRPRPAPPRDESEEDEPPILPPSAPGMVLDWHAQGAGPATLAPVPIAPAGAMPPLGATPWQPPDAPAGVPLPLGATPWLGTQAAGLQLPPGGLQLPPGVNPQNLLIIASPSPDRPDGQVLHVYMIQPPAGQAPDINVTVPHNQTPADAVPAGALPVAVPLTAAADCPMRMNEVLGLPWAGNVQPALPAPVLTAEAGPAVHRQGTAGAGPQEAADLKSGDVADEEVVDVTGAEVLDVTGAEVLDVTGEEVLDVTGEEVLDVTGEVSEVPRAEVQPVTAAAAGVADPAESLTPGEGELETQATAAEAQGDAGGEDAADRPPMSGAEQTAGADSERGIVLEMVSGWGDTIGETEGGASVPESRDQNDDVSLVEQEDSDVAVDVVESREADKPRAIADENLPVTTEADAQHSSEDAAVSPRLEAEVSEADSEPGATGDVENRDAKPITPNRQEES